MKTVLSELDEILVGIGRYPSKKELIEDGLRIHLRAKPELKRDGAEFAPTAIALQILSLYLPPRVISHVMGWALTSINREHLRTFSAGIALSIVLWILMTFDSDDKKILSALIEPLIGRSKL